ncbi:cytochrome-c oxidase, cbb3-type subunit III [Neisseriaceae bacterium B1]
MESQFTSPFWSYYIIAIVVLSLIGILWLLLSQNKVKVKKGEEVKTMGHSWDGIEEYNNPLPRWWFFMFLGTIIFSVGYLVFYPGLGDFKGIGFNGKPWTSHGQYEDEVKKAEEGYKPLYQKFAGMSIEETAKQPEAMTIGKNLFDTYCIQCHGSDAKGSRGFPNLVDTDWLYGGTPDKIHETIAKGRTGVMAAWGPVLGEEGVRDAAHFVMSLSGKEHNEDRAVRGKALFSANCAVCHGPEGKGTLGMAPNLTDDTWLWGSSEKAIMETITGGRHNQMPTWEGFLSPEKIHLLTAYVWGKSHPDGKALPTDGAAPAASAPAAAVEKAEVKYENATGSFYFATGKSDVAAEADKVVADLIKAGKDGKKLIVSGYTDSTGDAALNAELSKKRAQAVQAFFEKQGVAAANIELRKPENTTAAQGDNAQGRRVDVKAE